MRKTKLALSIVLPVVIVALAALLLVMFTMKNEENDLGTGIGIILAVVINIIPTIVCLPFAAAFLVIEICLFAVKRQKPTVIALLVLMTILLPVLAFVLIIDALMLASTSVGFLIVLPVTAVVYLAAYILCIAYFIQCRRAEKGI